MWSSLEEIDSLLATATAPEVIFGELGADPLRALKARYHQLIAVAHPDRNRGRSALANQACVALQSWYAAAQASLAAGTYGVTPIIDITTATGRYLGSSAPLMGDLCELYPASCGGDAVLLKVVRQPRDNDLLEAEAAALQLLDRELQGQRLRAHFPRLVESTLLHDARARRRINVLVAETGYVSLAEVLRAHPDGIAPQDAAWMFNRLLAALGATHAAGLVHGAVVPEHVLIRPADHNGLLVDWCYSVPRGAVVKALSPANREAYPPEITAKLPAVPATDIYMAARCMARLLGGDAHTGSVPERVPAPIRRLLAACLLPSPHRRSASAWQLFDDFREILHELYGPPVFRPFSIAA